MGDLADGCLRSLLRDVTRTVLRLTTEGSLRSLPFIAVLLLVFLALSSSVVSMLQAGANGTITVSPAELALMSIPDNPAQLYQISGTKLVDGAGLQETMQAMVLAQFTRSTAYFGVMTVGERRIVVVLNEPVNPEHTVFTGSLVPYNVLNVSTMAGDMSDGKLPLLPYYLLEQKSDNTAVVGAVVLVCLGLYIAYAIYKFVQNTLIRRIPLSAYMKLPATHEVDSPK